MKTASHFQKISVIGLGYIGLPTAAMFASRQVQVVGVDVNQAAVDTINQGRIHIIEPDLDIMVHTVASQGWLRATTKPEAAEAFLIAVPTPFTGDDHQPDLSYIVAAARAIAPVLAAGNLVILESTSPVGATETMASVLAEARPDLTFPASHGENSDIRVAYCPERVLPGKVMEELIANDRVIGGLTPRCSALARDLYKTFVAGACILTDARTAEMTKLTENSFRDVNIAFANELSIICERLGIDVWELISLANRHPRVNILQPGPGVGGHCIAVDPWFIVAGAPDEARLIRRAREVNDSKPEWVLQKVQEAWDSVLQANPNRAPADVRLAVYGLAFKPDIDDLRESPALQIANRLATSLPGRILIVEPNIDTLPCALASAELSKAEDAAQADIHVMLVGHRPFKTLARPQGQIIDTQGIWRS